MPTVSGNDFQTELLIRWAAKLDRLRARNYHSAAEEKSARLMEKVLRYLIVRYRDPHTWNRFAPRHKASQRGEANRILPPTAEIRPPRPQTQLRHGLETIRSANAESYRSYGI